MSKNTKVLTGEELGNKLLKSVREMKAGKAVRATQIAFRHPEVIREGLQG